MDGWTWLISKDGMCRTSHLEGDHIEMDECVLFGFRFWTRPATGGSYKISSVCLSIRPSVTKVLILPAIGFLSFFAWSWGPWSGEKWRSPIFEKKCWGPNLGKKGPKWAKNEVFCLFPDIKSLEFASIAYGNRERWYLAGGSGQSADQKCGSPNLGKKGPKWA